MATLDSIVGLLKQRFAGRVGDPQPLLTRKKGPPADQFFIRVEPADLAEVLRFCRDEPRLLFEQLIDLTSVDYLNFPGAADRYGVIYSLLSITHGHRLFIKCFVNDPSPSLPSATSIWPGADWMEREVFDMFGIRFEGHPDLRRILTWDGFEAHPLRKDYPLRGKGEREDYEVVRRDDA
jgi:NADH-quinone oxidoreductase subunit C